MRVNVYTEDGTFGLASEQLVVELPADVGPRISALRLAGSSENLLAETPQLGWDTPWGEYRLLGGHRLWVAPEDPPRTSVPDVGDVEPASLANGLRLERLEPETGLLKALEVELDPEAAALTVGHVVRNESSEPVTLAPWGITMLPLGGTAILPQASGGPQHRPERTLVLWGGTSWTDARLDLGDQVLVRAVAGPRLKVGQPNVHGWAAYLRDGVVLCKRFEPLQPLPHADGGCNVEVFCDESILELETLGPLADLLPGEETRLVERWEVLRVDPAATPAEVAELLGGRPA